MSDSHLDGPSMEALSEAHHRRQLFYNALLGESKPNVQMDFKLICKRWVEVLNAEWAWLWLFNESTGEFELTELWSRDAERKVLPGRVLPKAGSVADYCFLTGNAEYVENPAEWHRRLGASEFWVQSAEKLRALGCVSFDIIPLIHAAGDGDDPAVPKGRVGVVTIHYTSSDQRLPQPQDSLLLMGRLTALRIRNAFLLQQREMLLKLNALARDFLATSYRRPADIRREYGEQLIKHLRSWLNIKYVTLFCAMPGNERLTPLATTGLYRRIDGESVKDTELGQIIYRPGQGDVGACLHDQLTGEVPVGGLPDLYTEVPPAQQAMPHRSLAFPIKGLSSGKEAGKTVGAIRFTGLPSPLYPHEDRHFDAIEAETIRFLTEQLAIVLETLENSVQRERTIGIVKHDLYVPLNMIRDTVARMDDDLANKRAVREYDIKNLGVVHLLGHNLVDQLDPEPGTIHEFSPSRTLLEGEIVARLCNLLQEFAYQMKGMRLEYNNFREIPALMIDRHLVERAIANLILNAVKYGKKKSTISVEATRTRQGFNVTVSNFGTGVEPQDRPRLFTAGFRSKQAQRQAGVGLGLWIARQIMRRHGGDADIVALKDPTVFSLFFPEKLIAR